MDNPFIKRKIANKLAHQTPKRKWLLKSFITICLLGFFSFVAILIAIAQISSELPQLKSGNLANVESTIIYDKEGAVLYTIHGEENRKEIPLNAIPKHLIDATIAIEDDQFYEHYGIDLGGIFKAALNEFLGIGKRRGGSTITQQLVKNTLLSPERTLTRKFKEILLAIQIERTFSKNEILEMYLNTIPYGSNAYGAEMAAKTFFDKSAQELSLVESAILASLPKAPSRYSPYGPNKHLLMGYFEDNGKYIAGRKDVVLKRMEELEYISHKKRLKAIKDSEITEFKKFRQEIEYPHFVMYIKQMLEDKFGKEAVETGGLKVYTSIDPYLQKKAQTVIEERMKEYPEKYGVTNASLFSVDLETGQILAMVGSADYFNEEIDGNVNMVLRNRLPGSSFKPLVFAAGIGRGYSPASVFFDLETDFGNDYIPQNYDGTFSGPVTMRESLGRSLNIPAVKMAYLAGVDNILLTAKKMGITTLKGPDQYGLSIGLGTGETTLYQMVKAYSVFAKEGKLMPFQPFIRIEDTQGKIIESYEEQEIVTTEALDPQIAFSINHMLSDPSIRPDYWNTWLQLPDQINAAKTGTSNKKIREKGSTEDIVKPLDNWTIGYTTKVITGVWAGNNDSTPLKFEAAGLTTAGKIWHDYMIAATEEHDLEEFPKPQGIKWETVSRFSGKLPSPHTPENQIYSELFTSFNLPKEIDNVYQEIEIDRISGKLPSRYTPAEARTTAIVANFSSLRPDDPNWEKPVQLWAKEFIQQDATIIAEIPTEKDNIHSEETAKSGPTIQIISPQDGAIAAPGIISIQPQISASHGVEKVEYYLQGKLMDTVTEFPFVGTLKIILKRPRPYKIKAKIFDKLYYTSSDNITIIINDTEDSTPPNTKISFPIKETTFPAGETISILTNTTDDRKIEKVLFNLNGEKIGESSIFPYSLTYTLPQKPGKHTLSVLASDSTGNVDDDAISLTISESKTRNPNSDLGTEVAIITEPKEGKKIKAINKTVSFTIQLNPRYTNNLTQIELIATNTKTQTEQVAYSISQTENLSETLSFAWDNAEKGTYDFQIRTTSKPNRKRVSQPVRVTVE
jgi:membrane peptidoglycan carboxypeptidase